MHCPNCQGKNIGKRTETRTGNYEVTIITYYFCRDCGREVDRTSETIRGKPPKDPKSDKSW